ncbi:hypothetical protein SKAU_G00156530 [Synaphobranchus kaupii]|uniref:Uncharacterized protein n=1 Tax=Synaphobranchus kaupii TaxID=118154 RepID=A0A9Q1FHV1_SYNKA|nr:hypothetical protein SKAU_G00156530 [Synaphobranchus kaupii]
MQLTSTGAATPLHNPACICPKPGPSDASLLTGYCEGNARGPRNGYCHLNIHMPLLRMYFDSGDTKRAFRLARVTLNLLIQTVEEDNTLGWGKTLEVLVFLY